MDRGSEMLKKLKCSDVGELVQVLTVETLQSLRPRRPYHQQAKEWVDANPSSFKDMKDAMDSI